MTQVEKVLRHVKEHGSINVLEAMGMYVITQLGRVVFDTKGTRDALKAIPAHDLGDGFVRYVPDWEARMECIENDFLNRLHTAETLEDRQMLAFDFASELGVLRVSQMEHPAPKASVVELQLVS